MKKKKQLYRVAALVLAMLIVLTLAACKPDKPGGNNGGGSGTGTGSGSGSGTGSGTGTGSGGSDEHISEYAVLDESNHKVVCADCGKVLSESEPHDFDENHICKGCGYADVLEYILNEDQNSYTVKGYSSNYSKSSERGVPCAITKVIVPDTYKGKNVTAIGEEAFADDFSGFTTISLGKNITSIGKMAFRHCYRLMTLELPEKLTSIEEGAFYWCERLIEIFNKSPLTLTPGDETGNGSVAQYALNVYTPTSGSSKLSTTEDGFTFYKDGDVKYLVNYTGNETAITLPEGENYEVYGCAFEGYDALRSLVIPANVTAIASGAFSGCSQLVEIFNKSQISIQKGSNVGSYALNIYTPDEGSKGEFTEVEGFVFYTYSEGKYLIGYTGSKTDITLPAGESYQIGRYAFARCKNVTSVVFSDSIDYIPKGLFASHDSLRSVVIGDNVSTIDESAFYGCGNLTSVTIGENVKNIKGSAFASCYKLVEVFNKSQISLVAGKTGNGSVSEYALNVYTPTSGSSKLSTTEDGFVFCNVSAKRYLVDYTGNNSDITLPAGENYEIHRRAFCDNDNLKSVVISGSVTVIGREAFEYCNNLTKLTIGENVVTIGKSAFEDCGLTEVVMPSSVITVDERAFYNCDKLVSLTIGENVESIGATAFCDCDGLTEVIIPDNVISVGGWAFNGCDNLEKVTIGQKVNFIGTAAFGNCDKLASVIFKNTDGWTASRENVTDLGDAAAAAQYLTDTYKTAEWRRAD